MERLIDQLQNDVTKLLRAFTRLRAENQALRKQLAVLEMEQAMLQDKYHQANGQIMDLTNQLGHFEDSHEQ